MARAIDIAQVTYEAPDLALMERFMTDFGLRRVPSTDGVLYMRGSGHQHHLRVPRHAIKQRFIGATLEVISKADLEELAVLPGSSPIEWSTEPGGGWQVLMYTPDGIEIRAGRGREGDPRGLGAWARRAAAHSGAACLQRRPGQAPRRLVHPRQARTVRGHAPGPLRAAREQPQRDRAVVQRALRHAALRLLRAARHRWPALRYLPA